MTMLDTYRTLKKQYPDGVLLLQVGDFYEAFGEDAKTVAQTCNIVLTQRSRKGGAIAGFPCGMALHYVEQMRAAGITVALADVVADKDKRKVPADSITELVTDNRLAG